MLPVMRTIISCDLQQQQQLQYDGNSILRSIGKKRDRSILVGIFLRGINQIGLFTLSFTPCSKHDRGTNHRPLYTLLTTTGTPFTTHVVVNVGAHDVARDSHVEAVVVIVDIQVGVVVAQATSLVRDAVRLGRIVAEVWAQTTNIPYSKHDGWLPQSQALVKTFAGNGRPFIRNTFDGSEGCIKHLATVLLHRVVDKL